MGGWKASGLGSRHGAGGIRKYCQQQAILVSRSHPRSDLHMFPYKAKTTDRLRKLLQVPLRAREAGGALGAELVDQPQQVQRAERLGEEEVGAGLRAASRSCSSRRRR